MRRAVFAAATLAAATSAAAEERFLRIEVNGTLPDETKAAIERVFAEAEVRKARTDAEGQQTSLEQLCVQKNCSSYDAEKIKQFVRHHAIQDLSLNRAEQVRIPGVTIDGENFIAVPRSENDDPRIVGHDIPSFPELEFIPYDNVQWSAGNARVVTQELQPAVSPTLAVITDDLQILGRSSRQIAIPEWVDETTLASLQAAISANPEARETVSLSLETAPANEFEISLAQPVTFETGTPTGSCGADENWPFNAAEVARVIDFNFEVLDRLGVTRLNRSNVLVMDTGLGSGLAANSGFKHFLDVSLSEELYADTYFRNRSSLEPFSRVCLDVDGLTSSSDAFGFAIEQSGTTPTGIVPVSCRTHSPLDRIVALESPQGATLPAYVPEHGSFVAGLALGGPSLMEASNRIEDLIGLTFARITDAPNSLKQTVKTEVTTLEKALEFAAARGVDVLNASIRVSDINKKSDLQSALSAFDGVIVAAAGNFPEPITASSGSFPASVTDASFDDRLIVVAALDKTSSDHMWSQSAHHNRNVDIAAPGANITSLDLNGNPVCMSGTSAAAPLVSFVAGSLMTFGVRSPIKDKRRSQEEILHRIYATAEMDETLDSLGKVKDGRVLDVATALDVFVDHIWTEANPETPRRVLLQNEDGDDAKPNFIQACDRLFAGDLAASRGAIDANVMAFWSRPDGGKQVNIWHRSTGSLSIEEGKDTGCRVTERPTDKVRFLDLADNQVRSLPYTDIRRIAFSPFRKAVPTVRAFALEN